MKKERNNMVEIWRFIAAIVIMLHHLYVLGEPFKKVYLGYFGWIYVEFFFILTGYFTYKHFLQKQVEKDAIVKQSLKYTFNKFRPLWYYIIPAITVQYFVSAPIRDGAKNFILNFVDYPFEALLLGETLHSHQKLAPIWFLSAMLITLTIIAIISQIKNYYFVVLMTGLYSFVVLMTGLYSFLYLGRVDNGNRVWPNDLLRALAGMCLGVFICALTKIISDNFSSKWQFTHKGKLVLTMVEELCLVAALGIILFNMDAFSKIVILLFAIGIGVMLSGHSLTAKIHSNIILFLGKLSMPIFIWHWAVGTVVCRLNYLLNIPTAIRVVMYFVGTMVVSLLSYWMINKVKGKGWGKRLMSVMVEEVAN